MYVYNIKSNRANAHARGLSANLIISFNQQQQQQQQLQLVLFSPFFFKLYFHVLSFA